MKHHQVCYTLIPRKDNRGSSEIPLEFLGLLSKYGDVISNNILEGLSPIRQKSHQIDLVPGASFPSKAAHKMTYTKTEELNRQA